jgi:hypothetical protein
MKAIVPRLPAAVLAIALGACAGPGTASGRLDATLHGVEPRCLRDKILDHALSTGFVLKTSSDLQLAVQRPALPSLGTWLNTTGYAAPFQRLVFTFAPAAGGDVRLVLELQNVINPDTSFERAEEVRATPALQRDFDAMARRAELSCPRR